VRIRALASEKSVKFQADETRELIVPVDADRYAEKLLARERARLARQLHDKVASAMFATKLEVVVAAQLAEKGAAKETLQAALDHATNSANQALGTVREICAELREFGREEVDVFGGLIQLLRAFERRTGAQCLLSVGGDCSSLSFDTDAATKILSIVRAKLESDASRPGVRRIHVDILASERQYDLKIRFHAMGEPSARKIAEGPSLPGPGPKNSKHREGAVARAPGVARKSTIAVKIPRGSGTESKSHPSGQSG
jgi:signal transduction histidine kinase